MKISTMTVPNLCADSVPTLNKIISKIVHAVNNIEFGTLAAGNENVWCTFVVVDAGDADEVCSAAHSLRRIPAGTICVWQDAAGIWYKPTDAASADTNEVLYYICDTASTSAVLLLI